MNFWERVKNGRFVRVLVVYLAASWIILQLAATLNELFELPPWVGTVTLTLLAIGLVIVLATAWVQAHPLTEHREQADEVPGSWEVDVKDVGSALSEGRMPHLTWGRAILGGVFAFSLLFGFAGLYVVIQDRGQSFLPEQAVAEPSDPGIAFLPFEVSGTERANLREGMVTLLDTSLDGVAGVRAIDDRTVLALWEQQVGPDSRADLATALQVATATGARYALVGSVVDLGDQITMSGEIYELPGGSSLGHVQAEGSPDSLAMIVENLAIETLRTLGRSGAGGVPQVDLAGVTTHSLEAMEAYLDAEALFRTGEFAAAQPYYEAALEADSAFALAHYRMSQVVGWTQGAGSGEVQAHMDKALAGNLPPRMELLARAGQFQSLEPLEELEYVVQEHPEDAAAWFTLGDLLMHAGVTEVDDAIERADWAFARAVELDPGFAPYLIHPIDFAFMEYDPDKARERIDAYNEASPGTAEDETHQLLYDLVFDPPSDSTAFETGVDSLSALGVGIRYYILTGGQPRASRVGEAVALRDGDGNGGPSFFLCWRYALAEGRWDDFIAYATDPALNPTRRLLCLANAALRDYPVPDSLVQAAIADAVNDSAAFPIALAGAYAASRGRWDEYDARLAKLEQLQQALDPADSTDKRDLEVFRNILVGVSALERGDAQAAFDAFESVPGGYFGPMQRWWRGRINLELGRPDVAARWFQSFFIYSHPWTRSLFYLGRSYEELGEFEKAQEAYAEFVDIWKDADPELQPMVEEANLRLEAILAERF